MTDTSTPEFYGILTDAGEQLQFECLDIPDKTFEMLEIAVGDGNGSYYEPEKTQTKLKNECYRHAITRRMTDEENRVKSVILDIPEEITGFTIREVGVFGADGELLIIGKYPETPKRDTSSGAIAQLAIKVDLSQVNELILPVLIDPSVNTASVEYVEKYFQKLEEKGQPSGYASLDSSGLVPREQVPFKYVRGCVNSGSVDTNGEPDLMTYTAATRTVNVQSPFVYTTMSGKTYECETDLSVVLDEALEGTVRIFVDRTAEDEFCLKAFANNIYTQKAPPAEAQENDIWRDISTAPETQKIYKNSQWQNDNMVEIGAITELSGGGGYVKTAPFNALPYLKIEDAELEYLKITDANNTFVNKTGTETITGTKTFTQPIRSTFHGGVTTANLVVENINNQLVDTVIGLKPDSVRVGSLRMEKGDGYNDVSLTAANETGDLQLMGIRNTDGVAYGYAPTYSANYADTSTKIVTTAYMANHWAATKPSTTSSASKARPAVVIQNYVNGTSWYSVRSDGFIEQGGSVSDNSTAGSYQVVTFPKPFTANPLHVSYDVAVYEQQMNSNYKNEDPMIDNVNKNKMHVFTKNASGTSYVRSGIWYACGY